MRRKIMRPIALFALVLSSFLACGDDNLYGPEPPPNTSCAIDYLTVAARGTLPVQRIGQSWIAPCTGYLSSISVSDNERSKKGLFRLEIFKGESISDADKIGGFNNISISSGINQITVPITLLVTAGQQYTFLLSCDAGDCVASPGLGLWLLYSATPYPDGRLMRFGWENDDLYFKLVISANPP
jgi:hypothetical protein